MPTAAKAQRQTHSAPSVREAADDASHQETATLHAHWNVICARLRAEVGARTFDSWMKKLEFVSLKDNIVTLSLPTLFMMDWVRSHYSQRLHALWIARIPTVRDVVFVQRSERLSAETAPASAGTPYTSTAVAAAASSVEASGGAASAQSRDLFGRLEDRMTFDRFVVGPSNEFAFNAASRLAQSGPINFNPLFLHSGVGLGKTHLMHAIGHAKLQANPDAKVAYMTAERFMMHFLAALRHNDTFSFKQRLRSIDVLLVDDIQFIAGKDSTQDEFFHTMNALIDGGRQLVISADRSPYDLEGVEDRVRSRMQWGLVADINPADYELRLSVLTSKARNLPDVHVSDDVLEFIARRVASNIRELEGAFNKVIGHALLTNTPVTAEFARHVLSDMLRSFDRRITIDEIQRKTASFFNLRLADLLSARRSRDVARPRQVAMYFCKMLTPRSLPEIGRRFGGRDHTTVLHAIKRIEGLRGDDAEFDAELERLNRLLEN